ncbi:MAG: hypothetical protein JRG96_13780 [Deltaproteobacteria bacterium]|nr:hypothetical protein [Deltaproteobacteria bacterium]MBW2420750.1 hypothetical protein [Deltaproteobacteria bacterium]
MNRAELDPAPARKGARKNAWKEWSRRGFLARLGTGLLALLVDPARVARAGTQRTLHDPHDPHAPRLTESDRLIASVAGPYAARHPDSASRITRWAEAQLPPARRPRTAQASAALVRAHLLQPARIARELARDEVMVLDGWVLARSEGAAAVYLHALTRTP